MGICKIQHSDCHPCRSSLRPRFKPKITVNLAYHFDMYKGVVLFLKSSGFFSCESPELMQTITQYFQQESSSQIDQSLGMQAVQHVVKLYPEINPYMRTNQWLLNACLKHHSFVMQFPIQSLCYKDCLHEYRDFLTHAYHHMDSALEPSKCADFMWHVHMQDVQAYRNDCWTMFGFVLDHRDEPREIMNVNKTRSSVGVPPAMNGNNMAPRQVYQNGNMGLHGPIGGGRVCEPVSPCHGVRPCHNSYHSSSCHDGSSHSSHC